MSGKCDLSRIMYKQFYRFIPQAWACLLVVSLLFVACSTSGLTKKQREALDHYVEETADAIHFSATKVKSLLSHYKSQNGSWPKDHKERRTIFNTIDGVLEEHHISNQKLLEVDNNEVIVEYELSAKKFKQLPRLLESWVVIFSNEKGEKLEIVSIFPHWSDTNEAATKSSHSATQLDKLLGEFQSLLREKLNVYSITLSENINEKS